MKLQGDFTKAGVAINENADSDVVTDMLTALEHMISKVPFLSIKNSVSL